MRMSRQVLPLESCAPAARIAAPSVPALLVTFRIRSHGTWDVGRHVRIPDNVWMARGWPGRKLAQAFNCQHAVCTQIHHLVGGKPKSVQEFTAGADQVSHRRGVLAEKQRLAAFEEGYRAGWDDADAAAAPGATAPVP